MEGARASDDGHRGQVDHVLDWRDLSSQISYIQTAVGSVAYDEVRDNDLHDLGLQARPPCEEFLKDRNHQMSQWGADEGAIDCHLRHTAGEIVAALVAILGNPGCEELLECGERAGGDHLGAHGVILELLEIPLHLYVSG